MDHKVSWWVEEFQSLRSGVEVHGFKVERICANFVQFAVKWVVFNLVASAD